MKPKKHELLEPIQKCILALTAMSEHAAALEVYHNDTISRKLKKAVVDFEHNELKTLKDSVKNVRIEIKQVKQLKKQNNESDN